MYCSKLCANRAKTTGRVVPVTKENLFSTWVNVDHHTGCWNWKAGKNQYGYGMKRQDGKKWVAHRLVYSLLKGNPPDHLYACHTCDNPSCCNPDHIFFGTPQDNTTDAKQKGRVPKGSEHGNSKLTERDVSEIRRLYFSGIQPSVIATQYPVRPLHVTRIAKRRAWKHVD